ncbi:MAG: hypothetical protein HY043_00600 [Verrucomicrobia bacterium]|nr:hypothetical protein [Verrucomicrobiota bacterium]
MLKKRAVILGLGTFLFSIHNITQAQLAPAPEAGTAAPVEAIDQGPLVLVDQSQLESTTGRWGIDPVTWEIVGPPEDADTLALYNSPDQAESRRLAALAFTDPDEYLRLFTKTPEQLAAEAQAEFEITHPKTYDEHRASQTPEQNAAEDALVASILKAFSGASLANDPKLQPPPPDPNAAPAPDGAAAPATPDPNQAAPAPATDGAAPAPATANPNQN